MNTPDPNISPAPISMDKQYRTRDGRKARILCINRKDPEYPVIALVTEVDTTESVVLCTETGDSIASGFDHSYDLIEVPPTQKYRVALYQNRHTKTCFTVTIDEHGNPDLLTTTEHKFIRYLTGWIAYELPT